eukprot:7062949-Pyramimonas_sp.AAC.2
MKSTIDDGWNEVRRRRKDQNNKDAGDDDRGPVGRLAQSMQQVLGFHRRILLQHDRVQCLEPEARAFSQAEVATFSDPGFEHKALGIIERAGDFAQK